MKTNRWNKIWKLFEVDLSEKLKELPGHKEIPEILKEYREIISHELPETAPIEIFRMMILTLLKGEEVDVKKIRKNILTPLLVKESEILKQNDKKFALFKKEAQSWVNEKFNEERLQKLWKQHKTWLPRRYTIYSNLDTPFQIIATDTLARYAIIMSL